MLKIDNNLLVELGLGSLPEAEKNSLLKHIYETLEMRVGMRLADQMTNQQLDEFEQYFEAKDDAGAFKWLETNFPNYKDIVQQEFDKLKEEVRQAAPQILAASQASFANQTAPGQPAAMVEPVQPQAAAPAPVPIPPPAQAPAAPSPAPVQQPYTPSPVPQQPQYQPPLPPVPPTQPPAGPGI